MIHIKIRSDEGSVGTRKGWFIAPLDENKMLVVFKTDPEKRFQVVDRERISLDVFMPQRFEPIAPENSLSVINKKLRNRI